MLLKVVPSTTLLSNQATSVCGKTRHTPAFLHVPHSSLAFLNLVSRFVGTITETLSCCPQSDFLSEPRNCHFRFSLCFQGRWASHCRPGIAPKQGTVAFPEDSDLISETCMFIGKMAARRSSTRVEVAALKTQCLEGNAGQREDLLCVERLARR